MNDIFIADLALEKHARATVLLLNEYAKDEMGGGVELSLFVKENLVTELKKRPGIQVILAFVDDDPAGIAICVEGFSSFACKPILNIHDMAVMPKYRGRGLSRALLAKAQEIAVQLGSCKLTLEVLEGNTIAQSAYRAFGFDGYELLPAMGKALFWQKKLS